MHEVSVDLERHLVVVTLSGFTDSGSAGSLPEAIREATTKLGSYAGRHGLLCDKISGGVAPATVIEWFQESLLDDRNAHLRAARIAIVAPSMLSKLQMERLAKTRDGIAVFTERGAAEEWLRAT